MNPTARAAEVQAYNATYARHPEFVRSFHGEPATYVRDIEQAHAEGIAEHGKRQAIQDAHVRASLEEITRAYYATGSEHSYAVCRARLAYRLALRPHLTLSSLRAKFHDDVLEFGNSLNEEADDVDYKYSVAMRAACDLFAEEIERTVYPRASGEHYHYALLNRDGAALLDVMIIWYGLAEAQRRLTHAVRQIGRTSVSALALAELDRRAKATLPRKQPSVCTCGTEWTRSGAGTIGHTAACLHHDANRRAGL